MELEALFNAVIVKPQEEEETQYGSIVVPDLGKDRNEHGTVVAVGPGLFTQTGDRIPMTVKPGNTVMITEQSSKQHNQIKLDDEVYVLLRESEIMMVST